MKRRPGPGKRNSPVSGRIRELDWKRLAASLDERGYALTPPVLRARECRELMDLFRQNHLFRSTVDMRQVRFGSGVYRYFDRPLPDVVQTLREEFYPPLAEIANEWAARLRQKRRYPENLEQFLVSCRRRGQTKPTAILFRYETDDHNALHQDLYGEVAFPFQVVTVLSRDDAYTGGELVLCTQRPRAQSLVEVIQPLRGQMLIFPNDVRPALSRGSGRYCRMNVRHGVSRLRSGERYSLGIIFHDAR